MFEETDSLFNTESVPSNISYKSFKTQNLPMQNSYCDHRNFDSGNQAYLRKENYKSPTYLDVNYFIANE